MIGINQFFNKIKNTHARELLIRNIVIDSLEKNTGIKLSVEAVSFKSNSVVLNNISQTAKSDIFIKKQKIIDYINKSQKLRVIKDIK